MEHKKIFVWVLVILIVIASAACGSDQSTAAESLPQVEMTSADLDPITESAESSTPNMQTAQDDALTLQVPQGSPAEIDGILSPGEWEDALVVEPLGGGQFYFKHSGGYLFFGIQSNPMDVGEVGYGSVCLSQNDQISILHASAALGTAIYVQDGDGWQQTQQFSWCCRSRYDSTEREQHLQEVGWTASIGYLGPEEDMEYQVAMPEGRLTLGFVYVELLEEWNPLYLPDNLEDDCLGLALLSDDPPERLEFSPDNWLTVIAAD